MAISVGELLATLRLDHSEFKAGLDAIESETKKLGDRLDKVGKKLTLGLTLPLGLAAAASVKAGAEMDSLRRALDAMTGSSEETNRQLERLTKLAKLPGIGFQEAIQGSVRLQAVGFSAEFAERTLKAFANAIALTGGGRNELRQVQIQLGQLAAKGRVLAMDLRPIIEASPAVGRALKEAFGTVDSEQIQALGLSTREFLDILLKKLEELPRVQGGVKNSFENLSDAIFRLRAAIAQGILPVITPLVEKLSALAEAASEAEGGSIRWAVALGAVAAAAGPVLLVLGQLATAIAALKTALAVGLIPLLGVGGALIVGLGLLSTWFVKNKLDAAAAAQAVDEYAASLKALPQSAQILQQIFDTADTLDELKAKKAALPAQFGEPFERLTFQIAAAEAALMRYRDMWLKAVKAEGEARDTGPLLPPVKPDKGAAKDADAFFDTLADQPVVADLIAQAEMEAAEERAKALEEALRGMGSEGEEGFSRIEQSAVALATTLADELTAAIMNMELNFKRLFKAILADMVRLAAQFAVFSAFSALVPAGSPLARFFGLGKRAHGGPVSAGQSYVVGERGPELFQPHTGGTIVPSVPAGPTFDFSNFPPARDPRQAARDAEWQEFLRTSFLFARSQGFAY